MTIKLIKLDKAFPKAKASKGKAPKVQAAKPPAGKEASPLVAQARTLYFTENLDMNREKAYTLAEAADAVGMSRQHIRRVASKEQWTIELRARKAEQEASLHTMASEKSVFDEFEIRTRQAKITRFILATAVTRLQNLGAAELGVGHAIELLRLGLSEERKAVGLPDLHQIISPPENPDGFEPPAVKMERAQKAKKLHEELTRLMTMDASDAE